MAETQPGFTIYNTFYPFPQSFRMGDPVLITELTGMPFPEFAETLDDEQRRQDPVILLGLVGVAVWQANPRWRRERVARFVEQLGADEVGFTGGDDEVEGDPGPPAESPAPVGEDDNSHSSPETLKASADTSSEQLSPTITGPQVSGIGVPA